MDDKRLAIYAYYRKHRRKLDRPSGNGCGEAMQWAVKLGQRYRSAQNEESRIAILAALMNEARAWDLFARSLLLYHTFEQAAKEHVPELWG